MFDSKEYYLCTSDDKQHFKCKMFTNFLEADDYFQKNYSNKVQHSTIVNICRFMPYQCKISWLNYKLQNQFNPRIETKINNSL